MSCRSNNNKTQWTAERKGVERVRERERERWKESAIRYVDQRTRSITRLLIFFDYLDECLVECKPGET